LEEFQCEAVEGQVTGGEEFFLEGEGNEVGFEHSPEEELEEICDFLFVGELEVVLEEGFDTRGRGEVIDEVGHEDGQGAGVGNVEVDVFVVSVVLEEVPDFGFVDDCEAFDGECFFGLVRDEFDGVADVVEFLEEVGFDVEGLGEEDVVGFEEGEDGVVGVGREVFLLEVDVDVEELGDEVFVVEEFVADLGHFDEVEDGHEEVGEVWHDESDVFGLDDADDSVESVEEVVDEVAFDDFGVEFVEELAAEAGEDGFDDDADELGRKVGLEDGFVLFDAVEEGEHLAVDAGEVFFEVVVLEEGKEEGDELVFDFLREDSCVSEIQFQD
jgi:hypothetical protein